MFKNFLHCYTVIFFLKGKVTILKQKKLYLIGINRPEKRNSIDDETAALLRKAFEDFENDNEAYAAVLYGKGNSYLMIYLSSHSKF